MAHNNWSIEKIYNFCKLLKIDAIKKELDKQLEGYTLSEVKRENGEWVCSFEKENGDHLSLFIGLNEIRCLKNTDNVIERFEVSKDLLLTHRVAEKRAEGIVYSIITKYFTSSQRFNNEVVLVDLLEQRCVFTRDTLMNMLENVDFDNTRLSVILLKLMLIERKIDLKGASDLYTEFATHMSTYYSIAGFRQDKDSSYSSKTFLNEEDVSQTFDTVDGADKLYRIYDLYRGVINERNENDIKAINLGLLSSDAYDLMELKGIRSSEDKLIGVPIEASEDYKNYIKDFLENKLGFSQELAFDRDSIIEAITYEPIRIIDDSQELTKPNEDELQEKDCDTNPVLKFLNKIFAPFDKKS